MSPCSTVWHVNIPALVAALTQLATFTCFPSCLHSAMVASWVSQASFEPLGLTIAVAKDRAIESMMQVGVAVGVCLWCDEAVLILEEWD